MSTFKPNWMKKDNPSTSQNSFEARKKERHRFYNSKAWRQVRAIKLAMDPVCIECERIGTTVHHIKDRLSHPELAYDLDNLQTMCASCHSRLESGSTKQDTIFGNPWLTPTPPSPKQSS